MRRHKLLLSNVRIQAYFASHNFLI